MVGAMDWKVRFRRSQGKGYEDASDPPPDPSGIVCSMFGTVAIYDKLAQDSDTLPSESLRRVHPWPLTYIKNRNNPLPRTHQNTVELTGNQRRQHSLLSR